MNTPAVAGRSALIRVLPWHLTVAWLTVCLLYVWHASWLPSPMAAFGLSTVIGTAAAGLLVAAGARGPGARSDSGARPAPLAGSRTIARPPDVPGEPLAASAPLSTPEPVIGSVPLARNPFDALGGDLDGYPSVPADEVQCPHCGGFDAQPVAPGSARCRTCAQVWRPDVPTTVSVRSWLHHR